MRPKFCLHGVCLFLIPFRNDIGFKRSIDSFNISGD